MAKRTKKLSKSLLKLEALEQRQLLAGGFTSAQGQEFADIVHANGNVYDQVLLKSSAITVINDPGQITRVSFLDLNGDIVQAEFSGAGSLTISLDQFTGPAAAANYNQPGVEYVKGLATFTIEGSTASTNLTIFSVGTGTAHNGANNPIFSGGKSGGDHVADVARITIVADPANPNGSTFGGIRAANASFSAESGVVGITAANVNIQSVVRIGDLNAIGSATPTLVFGVNSQFGSVDVAGGDLIQANGKAINNNGSYDFDLTLVAGTNAAGTALPAQDTYSQLVFTDKNPIESQTAKTLSLTSLTDAGAAFTGTPGDDTYVAAIGSNGIPTNGTTLNPGDFLNGGGGTDTLSISISGTHTAPHTTASFTANNIETLSIANFETSGNASTIDLAGAPALANVVITSSSATGHTTLSSLHGLVGASLSNGSGNLTLNYAAAAVAGSSDVQALTVSGQTGGTFTANGIETLNVTSNTIANTVTAAGDKLATINVTGDKGLTLGTLAGTVTKVDASGLTAGNLSLTGASAKNYNIIGGAGNDSITLNGNFTASDTVNGGAGTDTLSIDNTGAIAESLFAKVSNVETLKLTGTAAVVTLKDNISATTFDLSTATAQELILDKSLTTAYTNATTVVLTGNGAGADKITNTANVALTVNAKDSDIANVHITGGTGADTLNLASDGSTVTLTNVTGVETINVTGSSASTLTLVNTNVASGKTLTIDGSTKTGGVLTVDGTAESDGHLIIKGGAGADVLTGGNKGSDTIEGGAGNDTIKLSKLNSTHVISGGDGSDTLEITGANHIASVAALGGVTGIETLKLSAAVNVTLAGNITATTGITTIDISDVANNVVTLNSGITDALAIKLGAGNDKVENKANVALSLSGNVADVTTNLTVVGGSGSDVLNLKADAGTATITNLSGVESITVGIDSTTPTNGATITMGANNTQIASGKTLVVDASALTNSGAVFTFNGNDAETDGFLSVTGGAGADVIIGGASGFDTLIGGAGNDSLKVTTLQPTNIIQGGDGTDTLEVVTSITTSSAFLGVTGVETLKLGATTGLTLTSNIAASTGITTINAATGGANTVLLTGGYSDATTINIDAGDSVTNGTNVALTVNANVAGITAGTTVAGGTGTDILNLTADNGTATLTKVSGVETITIKAGTVATDDATIVLHNDTVAAGKTLTINASALSDSGATLSVNGAAELDGSLIIIGGSGADTITGGAAADTFTGGSGADTFTLSAHANGLTFDRITDLADGDKIAGLDQGVDAWNSTKITLGSFATFADYLNAAAADNGGTNSIFRWFQFQGNTYVVQDLSAGATFVSGTDRVIEIQGEKTIGGTTAVDANGVLTIDIV